MERMSRKKTAGFITAVIAALCMTGCGCGRDSSSAAASADSRWEEGRPTEHPTMTPRPTPEPVSLHFVCAGDNLTHSKMIDYGLNVMGGDWSYMYGPIAYYIQAADVAVLNQETVLVDDPAEYSGYPMFGTPYAVADAAANAGFDIFTCATNHALDKYIYGIDSSVSYYDSRGIFYTGIQASVATDRVPYRIYEQNGIRCAILNYTETTNGFGIPDVNPNMVHTLWDEAVVRADLAAAEADADITIVFPHWGDEDSAYVNDSQRYWTQVFYEMGADVVVGTHPHVLEPFEMISDGAGHDMLVYYSIGNFVSAQSEVPEILGGLAEFTITKDVNGCRVTDYTLTPVVTHQYGEMRSQVYLYADYDDGYCAAHWMDISMASLQDIYTFYVEH